MDTPDIDSWVLDFARRVAPPETPTQQDEQPAVPATRPVISTPEELDTYVWETYGVRVPRTRVCPNHKAPWDAFCAAYFATEEQSVVVIKGSRGLAGKSFLMALLGNVVAATTRGDVTILGGSSQQSNRVHDAQAKLWSSPNAPRDELESQTTTKTRFHAGNTIEALTASQKSVRGPHPLMLILDEVDEMEQPLFDASMGQTMDQNGYIGRTVAGSTHQHADGTMTAVLKLAGERGWPVFEWCYRETLEPHGWLTESQVRRKRNEMTEEMWRVEVELGEPSITGRAIATEKVERMFIGPDILGQRDGTVEYVEFERPMDDASYAHGRDWARTSDFVAMVVFRDDVSPMRIVAYTQFRRRATPYILQQHEYMLERYPGRSSHDATSLGGKIMDDLTNPENADADIANEGIVMVGRTRHNLFTDYIIAVEHEEVVAPRLMPLYNQHKFVTNDDLRPRGDGHPPDGFVACCMAYKASMRSAAKLRIIHGTNAHPGRVVVPRELVGDVPPPALPQSPLGRALMLLQPAQTTNNDQQE